LKLCKKICAKSLNCFFSLDNYKNRSVGLDDSDRALLGNDLTDLEKYLVESQELIKIRGKVR